GKIGILEIAFLVLVTAGASRAQTSQSSMPSPGKCADPATAAAADAIAGKFDDHQFIFIGSTHGDLKIEEFLTCLGTRPACTRRATDIVVEWAGSGHQDLIDRYILALDPIPADKLAPIWFDTDAPTMWTTLTQVRRFVETLRDVNRTLPAAKRIRLVGGNEGVDWAKIRTADDLAPYPYKTNLLPHLLVEHLAKQPGNRTLVVYGDAHIHYQGNNFMGELKEALGRAKLFVVGRIGELVPTERPYLANVGDPLKPFFVEANRFPSNIPWPQSLRVTFEERSSRLADYIDGFVYLGPEPDKSLIGSIPLTVEQQSELKRRGSINSGMQRTMRARYQGKNQWFGGHPNDFPPRPTP